MAVVEHEVLTATEQRDDEVVTDAERRARTLEAAALEIEMRGWNQGTLCSDTGGVCISGAIAAAQGIDPEDTEAYAVAYETWFGREFGWDVSELLRLPAWNDQYGRTAEEVTAQLRSRANQIRSI